MIEFEILRETMPELKINFDEMEAALKDALEAYQGIVVTEETLPECKAMQKELAGIRRKIDTYRKDKKAELSKPILAFEEQCKQLIKLIESVETPIKDGISIYDSARRKEKRDQAEQIKKEIIQEIGLRPEFAEKLEIKEAYCNLTAKKSDVRDKMMGDAYGLKIEQDKADEMLEIIKDTIEIENQLLGKKMSIDDFSSLIEAGLQTREIIAEVKKVARTIYEAEHPKELTETEKNQIEEENISESSFVEHPRKDEINEELCFVVVRVTGTLQQLKEMKSWVLEHGMTYQAESQGRIS